MLLTGYPVVKGTFEDPTLRLAADEISALCRKRFQRAGSWSVVFEKDGALPSFEVRFKESVLTVAGPDAVEILYGVYDRLERRGGCAQPPCDYG